MKWNAHLSQVLDTSYRRRFLVYFVAVKFKEIGEDFRPYPYVVE